MVSEEAQWSTRVPQERKIKKTHRLGARGKQFKETPAFHLDLVDLRCEVEAKTVGLGWIDNLTVESVELSDDTVEIDVRRLEARRDLGVLEEKLGLCSNVRFACREDDLEVVDGLVVDSEGDLAPDEVADVRADEVVGAAGQGLPIGVGIEGCFEEFSLRSARGGVSVDARSG